MKEYFEPVAVDPERVGSLAACAAKVYPTLAGVPVKILFLCLRNGYCALSTKFGVVGVRATHKAVHVGLTCLRKPCATRSGYC